MTIYLVMLPVVKLDLLPDKILLLIENERSTSTEVIGAYIIQSVYKLNFNFISRVTIIDVISVLTVCLIKVNYITVKN